MANSVADDKKSFEKTETDRLNVYLEQCKLNATKTQGELKAFWEREIKRTEASIASFV